MSAESVLGWGIVPKEHYPEAKTLRQEKTHSIAKSGGRCFYFIEKIRPLTGEEAVLLKNAVSDFQSGCRETRETEAYPALKDYCVRNLVQLSKEQRELLLELMIRQVFGFGAMGFLLDDEGIEEIAVIGTGMGKPVFIFHRIFGWLETNLFFSSEAEIKETVNRMARKLERRLTLHSPRLNAVLPDGSRIHASIFPVSFSGPAVTIRKFTQSPFTPVELAQNRTVSVEALGFLWLAMQLECSVLIAGNTGSGKTSTLNSLFAFVPMHERIIIAEETPEIVLPHRHCVKLSVAESIGVKMQEIINDTFRMRPDRIIVGEMREREEARAFVHTLLAGQAKGSYGTFHAQSAKECLARLKKLEVMEMDLAALDFIIVQRRWTVINPERNTFSERRRITEIAETIPGEKTVSLRPLFSFDYMNDALRKENDSRRIVEKAEKSFLAGKQELEKEQEKRVEILKKLKARGLGFNDFFLEINRVKE